MASTRVHPEFTEQAPPLSGGHSRSIKLQNGQGIWRNKLKHQHDYDKRGNKLQ